MALRACKLAISFRVESCYVQGFLILLHSRRYRKNKNFEILKFQNFYKRSVYLLLTIK